MMVEGMPRSRDEVVGEGFLGFSNDEGNKIKRTPRAFSRLALLFAIHSGISRIANFSGEPNEGVMMTLI